MRFPDNALSDELGKLVRIAPPKFCLEPLHNLTKPGNSPAACLVSPVRQLAHAARQSIFGYVQQMPVFNGANALDHASAALPLSDSAPRCPGVGVEEIHSHVSWPSIDCDSVTAQIIAFDQECCSISHEPRLCSCLRHDWWPPVGRLRARS
jgi:hypothetical protein